MSELTLNRRLWAAYLRAGFDRAAFARAMGVGYGLVTSWDVGEHGMLLAHLIRASELVGYTLDELVHGRSVRPMIGGGVGRQASLTDDERRRLLDALNASDEQCRALGEFMESAAGREQRMTRAYVTRFVTAYEGQRKSRSHEHAMEIAQREARNARAAVDSSDLGPVPINLPNEKPTPKRPRKKIARVPSAAPH